MFREVIKVFNYAKTLTNLQQAIRMEENAALLVDGFDKLPNNKHLQTKV